MADLEKDLYEVCKKYNNPDINDFKGFLLFKAIKAELRQEELLASYIMLKQKFDSVYAFLLTKTRIIEISTYSTMYIITTRSFKNINKVIVEQEFDNKKIKEILKDEAYPERVLLKLEYVDCKNDTEEIVLEDIKEEVNVVQALNFANKLKDIQATNL